MIMYKFGEIPCRIEFDDFLSITTDTKKYKSDFKDFSCLYEFIEKNLNKITQISFDNYEYYLEKGVLHNLYGPAHIRYTTEDSYLSKKGTKIDWFYIDGKLVFDNKDRDNRGCRTLSDFKTNRIFHLKILTTNESRYNPITKRTNRSQDGIDYIKTYIDLDQRIKLDQRKNKLLYLNDK